MTPTLIRAALAQAESALRSGVHEVTRNRGPVVDTYHQAAGLDPAAAQPWCASAVIAWHAQAAVELDVENPRGLMSALVSRMWSKCPWAQRPDPIEGAVAIHLEPDGKGHCGMVWLVTSDGRCVTIEGNTNAEGSRDGDCVDIHHRPAGYWLGFLDYTRDSA